MQIFRNSVLVLGLALGLLAATPALASAASLYVYVDVYDSENDYEENDFTIEVDGEDASPDSFKGSHSGRKVSLDEGDYEVEVKNDRGFRVQYSGGCEGDIDDNDTERCYITLTDDDYNGGNNCNSNYNNCNNNCYSNCNTYTPPCYNNCYTAPVYTPPVTIQKGYVPYFPATGFEPLSIETISLAAITLLIVGFFAYPYGRKALASILR